MIRHIIRNIDLQFLIKIGYGFSLGYMLYEYVFYKKNPSQFLSYDFLVGIVVFISIFALDRILELKKAKGVK